MNSQPPKQCTQCGTFYLPHQEEDHYNMHIDPSKLAPKTSPNDMRKIQLAKVIIAQEKTDESDIALRSLLPDEIPKPEEERKRMRAPEISDDIRNDSIMDANNGMNNDAHNYNRVRDRLDLTSKLAATDLGKDQLSKLEIEKLVQIKQKTHAVPKKQIHKFQNSHYSGKQTKDLGGCEKKVMPNGLNGSSIGDKVGSGVGPFGGEGIVVGSSYRSGGGSDGSKLVGAGFGGSPGENDLGYEVKADNSYLTNPSKKSTVVVPINRRTGNPNEYKPVDTKANQQNGGINRNPYNRIGAGQPQYGSQDLDKSNKKIGKSRVGSYEPNNYGNGSNIGKIGTQNGHDSHGNHLHHHECPGCHGFYCQHCGSTIPPEYRPFWDPDESPDMVEYYKKRVRECRDKEREKQRKMHEGCADCHREIKKQKPF